MLRIIIILILAVPGMACAVAPAPEVPVEEVNVYAQNVDRAAESIEATEQILVCGSFTIREYGVKPIAKFLREWLPAFFGDSAPPCEPANANTN